MTGTPLFIYFAGFLAAYLVGSFPTGVVLTRRRYGIDVREMGSGNIGATNVTRVFGWWAGVLVFILDFLKGAIPIWALRHWNGEDPWLITWIGVGLVVGHCYSVFLKFRGGKGVATSFGCLAVLSPVVGSIAGAVYLGLLLVTRISALGSLGGLLTVLIYLVLVRPAPPFITLALLISAVVLLRHRTNIRRLIATARHKEIVK